MGAFPPRVLLVMPDQWRRALLRAALREFGFDAVGARSVVTALRVSAVEAGRGLVALVVVDQAAVEAAATGQLRALVHKFESPPVVLLARTTVAPPEGTWARVLRRPVSIAEIVSAVQTLLPLKPGARRPVD